MTLDRCFWAAFLLGVGVMAAVDEIVFHQILAWHHFYDRSTPAIGLMADGLLHAGELLALAAGFFLMLDARRRGSFDRVVGISGFFVGLGVFQVWDGIIDHKVLQVHQIRYGVDLLPYDIAWNLSGLVLLGIGVVVGISRHRRAGGRDRVPRGPRTPPARRAEDRSAPSER